MDAHQGLVVSLPLMGGSDVATRPCQTYVQRLTYGLVAGTMTTDIGHPVVLLILPDSV